ncbi:AMP-binding protein [Sphingomonas oligophenolica]
MERDQGSSSLTLSAIDDAPALTPIEMMYHWERETPDLVFLRQSLGDGNWTEQSWGAVAHRVRRLARYLESKALPRHSNIAIWSANSADWIITDLAIMMSGHVSVPLFSGQNADEANFILEQTQATAIFLGPCGREAELDRAIPASVERIGMFGVRGGCHRTITDIVRDTQPMTASPVPNPEDLMTIVYSSGTSGRPKGVMHTHATPGRVSPLVARILGMTVFDQSDQDGRTRLFSYLPLAHMAERGLVEMTALYTNAVVSISAGQDNFSAEIQSVQPTFLLAVPRLWSKFKAGLEATVPAQALENPSEEIKVALKQRLGVASAKFVMTASAAIPVEVHKWFLKLGIELREAYGMTETFACGAVWPLDREPIPGSVGISNMLADLKVSETGEVLVKSGGMMLGYYKNPQLTAEALDRGWFHTGDLGRIDADGSLYITGRIGSVFKTAKGKFCEPERVEKYFGDLEELEQVVLIGRTLANLAIVATLTASARTRPREELGASLVDALERINAGLQSHERVSHIFLSDVEWSADNNLLTPTLKLRRLALEEYYRSAVEPMLSGEAVQWVKV